MTALELIQKIGDEVCEGCGPNCEPEDCLRIYTALVLLEQYMSENKKGECRCGQ